MPVINYQLAAPGDQARCGYDTAGTSFTVSDLYVSIGRPGSAADEDTGGIVMPLDVPQGATINSATMQLYNDTVGQDTTKVVRVYADSALTQANFSASDMPSNAVLTTAFGSITDPTITANAAWAAIDIASVIQEIVSNGSWVQNNLIRFVISVVTPTAYSDNRINAAGTYSNTSNEPAITVDYTAGGGVTAKPILLLGVG